jgi:hypothetical protein
MLQGLRTHIAQFCTLLFLLFQGNNHHKHFGFDWHDHPTTHSVGVHFHNHDCDNQSHISEDCASCDFIKVVADTYSFQSISNPIGFVTNEYWAFEPRTITHPRGLPKNKAPPHV